MVIGTKIDRTAAAAAARRGAGMAAAILGAAAVFTLSLAAPVEIDGGSGLFMSKIASAKNDGGNGGGGGGNGGGGNGNGGGNAGGGNPGGGTPGGTSTGTSKGTPGIVSSTGPDNDRKLLLQPLVPEPAVVLAQFTTKIAKRYPADDIASLENPHQAVSFFTELQDMSGRNVTHRWIHDGKETFKASFKVRGDKWRVWSTQLLPASMPGQWKVEILNENGEVLEARTLNFAPKDADLAKN
jgi:hypothetical protein